MTLAATIEECLPITPTPEPTPTTPTPPIDPSLLARSRSQPPQPHFDFGVNPETGLCNTEDIPSEPLPSTPEPLPPTPVPTPTPDEEFSTEEEPEEEPEDEPENLMRLVPPNYN